MLILIIYKVLFYQVEEIADIEADDADFRSLNELELSEEQKRKYRKVCSFDFFVYLVVRGLFW